MPETREIEPSFLSGYARALDPESRVDRFCYAFMEAEKACGLSFAGGVSIPERAEAIVRAARKANLEPRLYELCWKVRKWANQPSA